MKYTRFLLLTLAVASLICSCKKDREENPLSYYVTPYPYDIVRVEEPPATNGYTYEFAGKGEDMWFAFGDEEAIDAVGEGT